MLKTEKIKIKFLILVSNFKSWITSLFLKSINKTTKEIILNILSKKYWIFSRWGLLAIKDKSIIIKIIKPISNTFNRGFVVKIFLKLNEYKKIKLKPIQLNGIENIW